MTTIRPQPGPQTLFAASQADIVFYGGQAGGGKSYALLMDPLRHYANPRFRASMFRRLTRELTMEGGLMESARELYQPLKGNFRNSTNYRDCTFPSKMRITFNHLQYLDTVYSYQGLQSGYIGFDELTHFHRFQFTYLITRGRSIAGIKTRIRGTCNPDPDSWVKDVIKWWLDKEGRFADPKKAGLIRYFIVHPDSDEFVWFNSRAEVKKKWGKEFAQLAKTFTFIPASLEDNRILLSKDPLYRANLQMQDKVTRARLAQGDWLIKPAPGTYFQRDSFDEVDFFPEITKEVRFFDRAATEYKPGKNDPDYTCSVKMARTVEGSFVITGLSSARLSAGKVDRLIVNTAKQDNALRPCRIMSYKDPGSAGKGEAERFTKMLSSFDCGTVPATVKKEVNAKSFSSAVENGNVYIWTGIPLAERLLFYAQLEAFPGDGDHDDYVDAGSGAYNALNEGSEFGII